MILLLIGYFILFYWQIISNPYFICNAESLDCDFGTMKLAGEYWRKSKLPQDPYFYKILDGARTGLYYFPNIFFSWLSSFFSLDHSFIIYVVNVLLHQLATCIMAYYLFGQGWIGLFGALAWSFSAYHIKRTLWAVELFTWLTASLLALKFNPAYLSITLGMLLLSGHPPFVVYSFYLLGAYCVIHGIYPIAEILLAIMIGSPQIYAFYRYKKISIATKFGYENKTKEGNLPLWIYFFMFIPLSYRDYIADVGQEEWTLYVTPLVGFFACFSRNLELWGLFALAVFLSTGKLWKYFHRFMFRWAYRWGYFAMLAVIGSGIDGLTRFNLNSTQLILLNIMLGILLFYNRYFINPTPHYPKGKKPSEIFNTPLLNYLETHAKGFVVNNLPYPVYTGQIKHIKTCGYSGGNHIKAVGSYLLIPTDGFAPYNWFQWKEDGKEVDRFGIKYHIGNRPSNDPKWQQVEGFDNLWLNTAIS